MLETAKPEPIDKRHCAFAFLGAKGEGEKEMVPDESGGTLDIKVVQTDKGIELRFPPNLLAGSKLVTFSWIDAYRR